MSSDRSRQIARESLSFLSGDDALEPTVLAWRPVSEWSEVQGQVVRSDARIAELMLGLVKETAAARNDEARLLDVIANFAFQAFPSASHHVLVAREEPDADLRTLIARARGGGDRTPVALSRTIVERVLHEGHALLYAHGQGRMDATRSIVLSRMETAIAAPLMGSRQPFGVIQLDVRRPAKGRFTKEDMDLLSVFASQVGLALEHLQMHQQLGRAFQSTINALVHSLTLKDPASASHSERVQAVAGTIGRALGLGTTELEILSVAAILHDLGKQGVRDDVLFKPGRLTDAEREEMDQHAAHTQDILDMIEYPEELHDVPRIAAYHHEKLDGTGPFGVAGDAIPIAARIISVADVFDALLSPRVYKEPLPPAQVLDILERGKDVDWDARVVDALRGNVQEILGELYGRSDGAGLDPPAGPDPEEEAA
ncbi:MAG TPA: HD domain-containing phosphohydrolase [Candidatus Eisenbacteria bacterium]|nr:HD domain-containing phosphohydrolase [Candidatus Eisenbacteria bacterium]